jgi:lipid-binding SYLF domain-containing protein
MFRFALLLGLSVGLVRAEEAIERLQAAETVFREIMASPDTAIPQELLQRAHCLGIIPSLKKGGFVVGAQYGKGVVLCRAENRRNWTGPSTVRLEGGSIGLQIGGGEVDVVFAVMNEAGAKRLMQSEFTIGGAAEAMAGPVGRSAKAETDAFLRAEILSWSRSRGVFAGAVLQGSTLRADNDDNERIYGRAVTHEQILHGNVPPPAAASGLIAMLNKYSPSEETGVPPRTGATRK